MAYKKKTALANRANYGAARAAAKIKYIVIHYTGNDGDSDESNAKYFQTHVVKASAHYFVDDDSVTLSVPESFTAWSVGGKKWSDCAKTGGGTMYGKITNTNSLNVELCDTLRNGAVQATEATMENAAALCRELMEKYGISAANVYRHFDVTGKHCPAYLMDSAKWGAFKARLGTAVMPNIYRVTARSGLRLRKSATTASATLGTVPFGTALTVAAIDGGWAKTTYGGKSGYCSSAYLKKQ